MEIDRVRAALNQAKTDADVWTNRASEATDRAGQIGAKVWNTSTEILHLGKMAAHILREEYPHEVGAANNEANDALRTMEANIAQTLAGSENQHATDAIIHARMAIDQGESIASGVATNGESMADLLEKRLVDLIVVMRQIARQQVFLPFLGEEEVHALQDLNDSRPITALEPATITLDGVVEPVVNTVKALGSYLEEL